MYNDPNPNNSVDTLIDTIADEEGSFQEEVLDDEEYDYATPDEALAELIDANDPIMQNVLLELNNLANAIDEVNQQATDLEERFGGMTEAEKMMQGRMLGKPIQQVQDELADQQEMLAMQQAALKRFTELKQLVAWMQPKDKRISRFCFYGCWCLPEGAHSFVAGEGRPVDASDKACQQLWFCYTCAKQEFRGVFNNKVKNCKPEYTRYSFKLRFKRKAKNDYSQRNIICRDRWSKTMTNVVQWKANCARAICECDRGLAMRLYRSYQTWDKSRHRIWSQKVTNCKQLDDCKLLPAGAEKQACIKRGCLFIVRYRCLTGGSGGNDKDHNMECCGQYNDDGGRQEMRDHGGIKACCSQAQGSGSGQKLPWYGSWYNTITHCCVDGQTWTAGSGKCNG